MAPMKDVNSPKNYNKSPQDLQTLKLFLVLFFLTVILFAGIQAFINFQGMKIRQPSTLSNNMNTSESLKMGSESH